ncbi:MAG: ORF6N domain-containing protein [Candidatus Omnitrophica bacterium]|nr:ORF6N domain-containing protein [Candidatus Omnitrophota bacterium]
MAKKAVISISSFLSQEIVERRILMLRGKKVMLDHDLASLYNVPTKVLNQAVKRNVKRFPPDFTFQLTKGEAKELVTNCDRFQNLKHSASLPYAFTELGVAMLSSVLNSERAIFANIQIMRTFVKLKEAIISHKNLRLQIHEMERKYDQQFQVVFKAIKALLDDKGKGDGFKGRRFET